MFEATLGSGDRRIVCRSVGAARDEAVGRRRRLSCFPPQPDCFRFVGNAYGLQRRADALEAQPWAFVGFRSPKSLNHAGHERWRIGAAFAAASARFLPFRGSRRRGFAIGKTSKIFTASSMGSPPPRRLQCARRLRRFDVSSVKTLKKNATAGAPAARQVDRLCRGYGAGAV